MSALALPLRKSDNRRRSERERKKSKCDVTSQELQPIDSSSPPSLQIETTLISNFKTHSNRAVLWAAKRGSRRSLADGECCFSVIAASAHRMLRRSHSSTPISRPQPITLLDGARR